jgi:hypothetical protein
MKKISDHIMSLFDKKKSLFFVEIVEEVSKKFGKKFGSYRVFMSIRFLIRYKFLQKIGERSIDCSYFQKVI